MAVAAGGARPAGDDEAGEQKQTGGRERAMEDGLPCDDAVAARRVVTAMCVGRELASPSRISTSGAGSDAER